MLEAFRLDENLMARLIREAHHLVFYGWAISRTGCLDLARVHRRAVKVRANQLVRLRARVGQMAKHLRQSDAIGEDRERTRDLIARRRLESREIDGVLRDARRRSGLQAAKAKAERAERIGERFGRRFAEASADG